ncbi:MAG: hypothetical protein P1U86_17110 [Verrucomicrobiales bacterium]|nr:hypothetical protein [Verrucomicrobiales bacterium]
MRKFRSSICLLSLSLFLNAPAHAEVGSVNIIETLDGSDRVQDGRTLDVYQIALKEHQSFTVTIQSLGMEGLLEIKRPRGAVGDRTKIESGAEPASIEVRANPGEGGVFEIRVSTLERNIPGKYHIRFRSTKQIVDAILKPGGSLVGDDWNSPEDAEKGSASPSPGKLTIEGVLESGDKTFEDGALYDAYSFEVKAGQSFGGLVQTHDFDGQLIVVDREGVFSSKAYPKKGGSPTGINKKIFKDQDGTYQLLVAAEKPGEGGKYTLTITAPNGLVTGPDGKVVGGGEAPSAAPAGGAAETFLDSSGQEVVLALGRAAYVDKAVSHDFGFKKPLQSSADPLLAVGRPDFDARHKTAGFFTLGEKGNAVWKFTDNSLVDGPGDDLVVFEIGQDTEPVKVEVSTDGQTWIEVGKTEGGRNAIDMQGKAAPGTEYFYVKLTDIEGRSSGRWPGADIDAIAAINGNPVARP